MNLSISILPWFLWWWWGDYSGPWGPRSCPHPPGDPRPSGDSGTSSQAPWTGSCALQGVTGFVFWVIEGNKNVKGSRVSITGQSWPSCSILRQVYQGFVNYAMCVARGDTFLLIERNNYLLNFVFTDFSMHIFEYLFINHALWTVLCVLHRKTQVKSSRRMEFI